MSWKKARHHCHKNFWKFVNTLLDSIDDGKTDPSFTKEAAQYFRAIYKSTPNIFLKPNWMPPVCTAKEEFDLGPIQEWEVKLVIKRARSSSSPSPYDQISYLILQKCPTLCRSLLDLYNNCWETTQVPKAWKSVEITLIGR